MLCALPPANARDVWRKEVVVVGLIRLPGHLKLLQVVDAGSGQAGGSGPRQGGQKHPRQDRDYRHDHEQLDQCEGNPGVPRGARDPPNITPVFGLMKNASFIPAVVSHSFLSRQNRRPGNGGMLSS